MTPLLRLYWPMPEVLNGTFGPRQLQWKYSKAEGPN